MGQPATPPANFKSTTANIGGINIHYVIGGSGEPLLLIHGFGQNWYMWNRLLPALSEHFTVIAPDLPGLGESDKPDSGYTKKELAKDLHGLMQTLGLKNPRVVGHDIGLMVAYAYAAQYRDEVKKLALLDALLPGVEPVWSEVRGKAAFPQDAADNKEFMKHKLKMPLLAMGSEYQGTFLPDHCKLVAEHVTASIIKDAGHWIVQENTEQVKHDLLAFLLAN